MKDSKSNLEVKGEMSQHASDRTGYLLAQGGADRRIAVRDRRCHLRVRYVVKELY